MAPAEVPESHIAEWVVMVERWTAQRARAWFAEQPWLVGCNFTPSTAINQLEMWQASTFDLATIDRELSLAASIGMNAARVYLHDLLWLEDERWLGLSAQPRGLVKWIAGRLIMPLREAAG